MEGLRAAPGSEPSAAKLNYSSFVYFDLDHDGRYGLGDRR